ncbi:MAG: BlaI/MecI/CopY family transcriptional regulator [Victivallaceae bacterium]|nr:BlaI/MecI/CopY family transcriptional regulator [Victivallaceae bacterium]
MKEIQISDGEAEVMKVLWAKSPLTLPELVEAVMLVNSWKYVTVKTLLQRLLKKGAVAQNGVRRNYLYTPMVKEEDYLDSESQSFLERRFNASPTEMLAFFVKRGKITGTDLKSLETQIENLKDE